jgi:FKBP-type peptidyl-prolyl cis-trans isomerase
MKIGQSAKLTLRCDYAYGEQGSPPRIPAKATLIFEVTLNKINRNGAIFPLALRTDLHGNGACLREITAGQDSEGEICQAGDHIWAHYKGTLQDGTMFDQSHGKPHREPLGFDFTVGAGQVITGWDVGFEGMKIGQSAKLTLRCDYAYGEQGSPPRIPAKATLIFEVTLNKIDRNGQQFS